MCVAICQIYSILNVLGLFISKYFKGPVANESVNLRKCCVREKCFYKSLLKVSTSQGGCALSRDPLSGDREQALNFTHESPGVSAAGVGSMMTTENP